MRKYIIILFFSILFIIYLFTDVYYRKYRIVGASLQRALFEDTMFNDSIVYLLTFEVDYCDGKLTFMQAALPFGDLGCADVIKKISIKDANGKNVNFIGNERKMYIVSIKDDTEYITTAIKSGEELDDLVKDINNNYDDDVDRLFIDMSRCYKLSSKNPPPKYLKIYSNHGVVNGIVNENPVILRMEKEN